MNPFFSVCIPVTDRGATIYDTLVSVAKQTFRNFELVIIDCGSEDNSRDEIERFFNSGLFHNNSFPYIYEKRNYRPQTVEDWNEPVKLATGKYIAMLEGDDKFLSNHLCNAYEVLSTHNNIGLYAEGNQHNDRKIFGVINHDDFLKYAIEMYDPAPPSEAIFVRLDKNGMPFLYDDEQYEYAPETDLYVRLALNGFDSYHSKEKGIVRDVSPKDRTTWHFYVDRFTLLHNYECNYDRTLYRSLYNQNLSMAIRAAIKSKSFRKFVIFSKSMIKMVTFKDYMKAFPLYTIEFFKNRIYKRG